jgi:hypothetical protein
VAVLVAGAGLATWAAFSSAASNSGNSFAAGSVSIADNDSGGAVLSLANARPGDSDTGCIVVTYTGSLPSTVRLYGQTGGTGLDAYLNLKITRGSIASPSFRSCTGFTADSTDYIGSGAGVVYNGTLQGFADTYAAGLQDAPGSPATWVQNETHAYKLDLTLQNNSAAAGKSATQDFVWEAQNQ